MKYMCWDKDRASEEYASAVEAADQESAAEKYADKHFSDLDYPPELTVFVKDPYGVVVTVEVEVRAEPVFYARIAKG